MLSSARQLCICAVTTCMTAAALHTYTATSNHLQQDRFTEMITNAGADSFRCSIYPPGIGVAYHYSVVGVGTPSLYHHCSRPPLRLQFMHTTEESCPRHPTIPPYTAPHASATKRSARCSCSGCAHRALPQPSRAVDPSKMEGKQMRMMDASCLLQQPPGAATNCPLR